MRWTKIKNIILLLLVIVNLFLLALVGVRAWRTRENNRVAREQMLQVLENNGISYLPSELPDTLGLTPRRLTPEPVGEAQVKLLVGEIASVEVQGSRTVCEGERGTVTLFTDRELEVQFRPGTQPAADIPQLLESLGLSLREAQDQARTEQEVAVWVQLLDGVPIPGETVRLESRDGWAETLTFRSLVGSAEAVTSAGEPITALTAILRLLDALNKQGYVCSQITDLYAGYSLSGSGTLTLTPAWFVEIDAAPWRLAIDAYTGEVTTE